LFHLEDDVDSGDIVAQVSFPIEEDDTCATTYEKASQASVQLLREYLPRLADGTAPRIPQDEGLATSFPQRKPEDGLIDWTRSPEEIRNFIRAQTKPYPGAFTYIGDKKVTIWDAYVSQEERS
jgi:methionyl-tRNA formyltransferase